MSDSQWPHQPQPTTALASLQTVDQARAELEARLMGIHNDLQLTQTIGLLFVKRQEDLKQCFDQLQELKQREAASAGAGRQQQQHQEPLPDTLREQLAILDKEFQEGQNGILGLKGLIDAQLVRTRTLLSSINWAVNSAFFFLVWWPGRDRVFHFIFLLLGCAFSSLKGKDQWSVAFFITQVCLFFYGGLGEMKFCFPVR